MSHLLVMLVSPRVTRCDLFIEQMCNLHSLIANVCLSGHPQPALILFQLLQVLLEIKKRVIIFGLLRAVLHRLIQGCVSL
jgi:hypothetical protein